MKAQFISSPGNRIAGIVRSAESVSLELLRAIDGTVSAMGDVAKIMSGLTSMLYMAAEEIKTLDVVEGQYIDPDGKTVDGLERSAEKFKDFLTGLVKRRSAILKDERLQDHHCEALHDAYDNALETSADMIEALQEARAAIITHDLAAEPRGGNEVFSTVSDLIANLRGK